MTDLLAQERGLDPRVLASELAKPTPRVAPTCRTCGVDVEKRKGELVHVLREANGETRYARSRIVPRLHGATR